MQIEHVVVYREAGKFAVGPLTTACGLGATKSLSALRNASNLPRRVFMPVTATCRPIPCKRALWMVDAPGKPFARLRPSPDGRGFSADEHMVPELRVARAIEQGLEPLPRPYCGRD